MLLTLTAPPDRRPAVMAAAALVLSGLAAGGTALFADGMTGENVAWTAVVSALSVGGAWVVGQLWKYREDRKKEQKDIRDERKRDEADQVGEYRNLLARAAEDRKELIREHDDEVRAFRRETESLRDEVRHLVTIVASAKERIIHLEDQVSANNPHYKPWVEPPMPSGRHPKPDPKTPPEGTAK